jgi:glucose 1-dehydrogenase
MRALVVSPGKRGSMRLADVAEPELEDGSLLVEAVAVGICGTDREILDGQYGWPPPARDTLITRRVPLADWRQAFARQPHDVKVILELASLS